MCAVPLMTGSGADATAHGATGRAGGGAPGATDARATVAPAGGSAVLATARRRCASSPETWRTILFGREQVPSRRARTARRRLRARRRRQVIRLAATSIAAMTLGMGTFVWMAVTQANANQAAVEQLAAAQSSALQARAASLREDIAKARAYNRRIAVTPQVIGEALFDGESPAGDFSFRDDAEYHAILDLGDGIMGALRIPKIGLTLPIRHGADDYVLANGVGHLHGTSMPVGGASTHTVLTGHRGLADKELFTRLDELTAGDPFYLELGDGTVLAYLVHDIRVAEPHDTAMLAVRRNADLATLVTCTPVMLNTHRLLVTGRRASMPDVAPPPEEAPGDRHPKAVSAAASGGCLTVGWGSTAVTGDGIRRRAASPPRHERSGLT